MGKKIIWTNHAIAQLSEAFLELLEQSESIKTAIRVIDEIHESASILATDPEIYKLDPYRKNNKYPLLQASCLYIPPLYSRAFYHVAEYL
ncbi:hypothetical protein [Mariniflexile sp.]|uniref:hypothetical protein n=1 Tax=Mariniflexile sp. TaxID=1979402 RepID=UPI0040475B1C